jgi:GNAT superfamily N-acetyltransferase
MQHYIVSISDRPDLAPVVTKWLWETFLRDQGHSFEHTLNALKESAAARPAPPSFMMPLTFVLIADGEPVGTGTLAAHDLPARPDLTPWLAGMFVEPHARGRGYAAHLIAAVEEQARTALVPTLWLHTNPATERVYARAGWRTVKTVQHNGKPFALMRRDLVPRPLASILGA